jgi:hypothetical protein
MTHLRRFALVVLLCSLGSTLALAENNPSLDKIKRVYIEKMKNNLDQYITAEISKQFHGTLMVVLAPGEADAIMKGVNIGALNTTEATIELVDPAGKVVLWSGTGNDRNLIRMHGGEQGVASSLVKDLRKSMQVK